MTNDVSRRASQVRLALFDVDGVMTDGTLFVSEQGESFKPFNILDGLGLKLLKASGVTTGFLTGRSSASVKTRASELAIEHLIQGAEDKLQAYADLCKRLGLDEFQVCYMGDDLPDLPVLRRCGLALSPPNAVKQVREQAHFVTRTGGGRGAVREACELIMQAQGTWESQIGAYLA
ncbi:MAG: HAD hydrolase family protein [Betaproteobacteria bacterium]|jgi:3-deoxy-D-manno-octulosonate 8-phosphate phosphatase (KDO 8-P phosphatase)|nr:MAG: HAD hydrolase family protein [Betaproteobacteria bacterium]